MKKRTIVEKAWKKKLGSKIVMACQMMMMLSTLTSKMGLTWTKVTFKRATLTKSSRTTLTTTLLTMKMVIEKDSKCRCSWMRVKSQQQSNLRKKRM